MLQRGDEDGASMSVWRDGNEKIWASVLDDENSYYDFVCLFVEHVTMRRKMIYGLIHGNKNYEKVVSVSDEAFAMLVFEDRMRLWMEVVKRRDERPRMPNESEEECQVRKLTPPAGINGSEKSNNWEQYLKDSKGSPYTRYSNGGTLAPNVMRGWNVWAIERINELQELIEKRRQREDVVKIMGRVKVKWVTAYKNDNVKVSRKNKVHYQSAHRAEGGKAKKKYKIVEN